MSIVCADREQNKKPQINFGVSGAVKGSEPSPIKDLSYKILAESTHPRLLLWITTPSYLTHSVSNTHRSLLKTSFVNFFDAT